MAGGSGFEGYAAGGSSLRSGIGVSTPEWGMQELGMVELGDSVVFRGDARPGQGCFGSRQALSQDRLDLGPGWAIWGLDRSDLRADGREERFLVREGSGYDRNVAGQEISAQHGVGQGEFQVGSSGFAETGVN